MMQDQADFDRQVASLVTENAHTMRKLLAIQAISKSTGSVLVQSEKTENDYKYMLQLSNLKYQCRTKPYLKFDRTIVDLHDNP